jgi:hypothetical protein
MLSPSKHGSRCEARSGSLSVARVNRVSSASICVHLWFLSLVLAFAVLLPAELSAQGCAMCRTALGGPDDPLTQAFNTSILFLMSMPFVLTASVGVWFLYMYRRGREDRSGFHVPELGREDQP